MAYTLHIYFSKIANECAIHMNWYSTNTRRLLEQMTQSIDSLSVCNQARAILCTGLLVQYADQCSPWVQRNYKRPYDLCSDIVLLFYGQ